MEEKKQAEIFFKIREFKPSKENYNSTELTIKTLKENIAKFFYLVENNSSIKDKDLENFGKVSISTIKQNLKSIELAFDLNIEKLTN